MRLDGSPEIGRLIKLRTSERFANPPEPESMNKI
jgi:hypothetical protein